MGDFDLEKLRFEAEISTHFWYDRYDWRFEYWNRDNAIALLNRLEHAEMELAILRGLPMASTKKRSAKKPLKETTP